MVDVILIIILIACGVALVVKGSDYFVGAAIGVSRALNISEAVIGATVVTVGTTLPELVTGITAIAMSGKGAGYADIAVGNSFGSLCCNIGLVLALSMMSGGVNMNKGGFKRLALFLTGSLTAAVFLALGKLTIAGGIVLLAIFAAFLSESLYSAARDRRRIAPPEQRLGSKEKLSICIKLAFGAGAIAFGAYLSVENTEKLCGFLGVPEQIIGATVVAVGTSIPELATTIAAIRKGSAELGLWNIIGANIVNATLLIGLLPLISGGVAVDGFTSGTGAYFLIALTLVTAIPLFIRKKSSRLQGALLMIIYIALITVNAVSVACK